MVKTYSYKNDGNTYISNHFQVKEFAAIVNGKLYTDTILIDDELINKLEIIFSKCNCNKAIISSGYRNKESDIAAGGSGVGQHLLGKAVDICYYDSNNKIIPSKIICCIAQDINIKGIAYITNDYTHLDVRSSGTYRGDETRGTNTVTNDFYNYFNISKNDVNKYISNSITQNYQVYDNIKKRWLPNVEISSSEYAGNFGNSIGGLYVDNLTYKVHDSKKNIWLKEVIGRSDYAGILGNNIDGVMIKNATYRVHIKDSGWLPWVNGYNEKDSTNGYAGILGKFIDAVEIKY